MFRSVNTANYGTLFFSGVLHLEFDGKCQVFYERYRNQIYYIHRKITKIVLWWCIHHDILSKIFYKKNWVRYICLGKLVLILTLPINIVSFFLYFRIQVWNLQQCEKISSTLVCTYFGANFFSLKYFLIQLFWSWTFL